MRKLKHRHPSLFDEKDVACVMIAALCHDLGHGPNSHLWEEFIKEVRAQDNNNGGKDESAYKHEDMTIKVFEDLVDSNGLKEALKALCGLDDRDFVFIKVGLTFLVIKYFYRPSSFVLQEVMTGLPMGDCEDAWPYQGRGEEKAFLYEVVANKRSGIDVDKWDYFERDNYYLNIGISSDPMGT